MTRSIITLAVLACMVFAVTLSGCHGGQYSSVQEDVIRALNMGESGLLIALTIAEVLGADHDRIEQARAGTTEAFNAAHKLAAIQMNKWDKAEMLAAADNIEAATKDVISVCRIAGVSQPILSMAEDSAIQAYKTLRDVINALPDRTAPFRLSQVVAISGERL